MKRRPASPPSTASPDAAWGAGIASFQELAHGDTSAARIADALRRAIIRCELSPGDRLSEAEVSGRFGVSRQPVREAFIRLQVDGLVDVRPKSGTRVLPIDDTVIRTARFVREAVEVHTVREIVELGFSDKANAELTGLVAAQEATRDPALFLDLDEAFHRALADAAGMGEAWSMIDAVKAQMDRVRYLSAAELHRRRLCAQHRAILTALAAGDEAAAVEAMRAHLTEILRSLPGIADRYPAMFAGHARPKRTRTNLGGQR